MFAPAPVRLGDHRAVARHDPLVAVDELRAVGGGEQRRQLVRMPVVVLVGGRDEARARRRERQRALEVRVEPAPAVGRHQHEALVVAEHRADLGELGRSRAVVGDDAEPVRLRLRADRLDLAPEQLERRLEGRHADRHARRPGQRLGQRRDRDSRQRRVDDRARGEPRAQAELDRPAFPRADPRQAPEPGAVRGRLAARPHQVEPRHPVRRERLLGAVDQQREPLDALAGHEARAADEQGRAGADRQLRRERCVEADVQGARRAYPVAMPFRRIARALRGRSAGEPPAPPRLDSWLEHYHGERLAALDEACADGGRRWRRSATSTPTSGRCC